MALEIFEARSVDPAEFVSFWSRRFEYPNPELYERNIGRPFTKEIVHELFTWKNGNKMSPAKMRSVEDNYVATLKEQIQLDTVGRAREYVESLNGGAIWNIFWLHCRRPDMFPIFDKHIYRAMARIKGIQPEEIPHYDAERVQIYFETYLPFLADFQQIDARLIYPALFAYGQFLKSAFVGKSAAM